MSGNDKVFLYRPQGDHPPRTRLGDLEIGRVHEISTKKAEAHLGKFAQLTADEAKALTEGQKSDASDDAKKAARAVEAHAAKQIAEKAEAAAKRAAEKATAGTQTTAQAPAAAADSTPAAAPAPEPSRQRRVPAATDFTAGGDN